MDRKIEAPRFDRMVNRGDIYWVAADPAKGAVPGVPHPHLVVQDDVFNHSRISTVIVCALSSNLRRAAEPGNVLLNPGEGGLMRQSVVVSIPGVVHLQVAPGRPNRGAFTRACRPSHRGPALRPKGIPSSH